MFPFALNRAAGPARIGLILFVGAWFAGALAGHNVRAAGSLAERLQPLIDRHPGKVAVAVKHLGSGELFRHQADQVMPTASLIKFPIMIEAYRQAEQGTLNLAQSVTLRDEDKVPGSGILTHHFSVGAQFTVRDAIRLMIAYSDNTATNLVIDQIGLPSTTAFMSDLNCPQTQLNSKVFRRDTSIAPERSQQYGLGTTTADEMVTLFERLSRRELVSAAASEAMYEHLLSCDDRTKIARLLSAETRFAHKTGAVADSRCDAGLLETPAGTIALCVLTTDNEDSSWRDDNAAHQLCSELGKAVYDYFNPAGAAVAVQPLPLAMGAQGSLVESLQRTLNARAAPEPPIDIDGDFGPQTEAAVKRFQELQGLPVTGTVNGTTWSALGPLIEVDPAVPEPAVVNHRQLPRRAADSLSGPPHVSCRAWCIVAVDSGELLWGHEANRMLDPASTTKIMTALVTLRQASEHPELLAQDVVFSQRADETIGSTAGLSAGEIVPLRELLYGLLLPSGNDAAVAVAEHVGRGLIADAVTSDSSLADPLDRFVERMNQVAAELQLSETHFQNPHGLTSAQHKTSARDLAKLARAALADERFRQLVGTREYGCTVRSLAGYQRHVLWQNTNRLLETDGYLGIKTGTTDAAGACLVSSERRADRELIVVVLGATSSDGRYVDTRNLFRWAWRNLLGEPTAEARILDRSQPVVVSQQALQLHQQSLLFDGHNDLPWHFRQLGTPSFTRVDLAQSQAELHTDIPRLKQGGVGAQFWSVYVPVEVGLEGKALLTTLEQIELVHAMVAHYPETFMLARSAADVRAARQSGKIASLIGMEGGHCIENSLGALRQLYQRGARYMTLTHTANLEWADSATDSPQHGGLTAFGEEVVREMNRLGMLVDLSHVSVETMKHALRITRAPVIFSHSSARAVADHPRNVPDDVLRQLPANGGVVLVNFYPSFVVPAAAQLSVERLAYQRSLRQAGKSDAEVTAEVKRWESLHPAPRGTIYDVVDHIDHIVRLAGIDHVGIGSDYDGIDAVPEQLADVSAYPRITQVLLDRGYSAEAIGKILGGNLLRALEAAEAVAEPTAAPAAPELGNPATP